MPRFVAALNKWVRGNLVTPVPSANRSTNSNSGALDASEYRVMSLKLDVTATTGGTLNVSVEESDDGTTWRSVGAFGAKTTVTSELKSFAIAADYYRVVWTISAGNATFSVAGPAK
jgi:hypothetical protein